MANSNSGEVHSAQNHDTETISRYGQALRLKPDWAPLRFNLRVAKCKSKNKKPANEQEKVLEKLIGALAATLDLTISQLKVLHTENEINDTFQNNTHQ